jgi:hypothetical protein
MTVELTSCGSDVTLQHPKTASWSSTVQDTRRMVQQTVIFTTSQHPITNTGFKPGKSIDLHGRSSDLATTIFCILAPCSLVEVYRRFRGACCLHRRGDDRNNQNTAIFILAAMRTSYLTIFSTSSFSRSVLLLSPKHPLHSRVMTYSAPNTLSQQ